MNIIFPNQMLMLVIINKKKLYAFIWILKHCFYCLNKLTYWFYNCFQLEIIKRKWISFKSILLGGRFRKVTFGVMNCSIRGNVVFKGKIGNRVGNVKFGANLQNGGIVGNVKFRSEISRSRGKSSNGVKLDIFGRRGNFVGRERKVGKVEIVKLGWVYK